jgi:hypothetical protein
VSAVVDQIMLEDMLNEDMADIAITGSYNEAIDTLLAYDEDTKSYDPDSGMMFPPEIKDYNEYLDEVK